MAYPANFHFSKPVEMHQDEEFEHARARLFRMDRGYNALDIDTGHLSGSHVVTVSDESEDNWQTVRDQVAVGLFGYVPGATQAYVRDALRPAMRGQGRGRNNPWR